MDCGAALRLLVPLNRWLSRKRNVQQSVVCDLVRGVTAGTHKRAEDQDPSDRHCERGAEHQAYDKKSDIHKSFLG
jgi:hypothetical protein